MNSTIVSSDSLAILVLEGNPSMRAAMKPVLSEEVEKAGCKIDILFVDNRQAAAEALKARCYAVVSLSAIFQAASFRAAYTGIGVEFISSLERLQHKGYTVFYADDHRSVTQAGSLFVAGFHVWSHQRGFQSGMTPVREWAELCVRLAVENKTVD